MRVIRVGTDKRGPRLRFARVRAMPHDLYRLHITGVGDAVTVILSAGGAANLLQAMLSDDVLRASQLGNDPG